MIRDHLVEWRKEHVRDNYNDYLKAVLELPPDDHDAALALWNLDEMKMATVLVAMHHVEKGRQDLQTLKSRVEQLKDAIKAFEAVQDQQKKFGASDTEPDHLFQMLLKKATQGQPLLVPYDGEMWELFADEPGCDKAAEALGSAAQVCVDLIKTCPVSEKNELEAVLRSYCWRCSW